MGVPHDGGIFRHGADKPFVEVQVHPWRTSLEVPVDQCTCPVGLGEGLGLKHQLTN